MSLGVLSATRLSRIPSPLPPNHTLKGEMTLPPEHDLPTPSDPRFHFPYPTPYTIQSRLQEHLYRALAKSQVTVIESPTGTVSTSPERIRLQWLTLSFPRQGKSLSLLCSSLTFLSDLRAHDRSAALSLVRKQVEDSFCGVDEPEWVLEQEVGRVVRELERGEVEVEERLGEVRRRERERAGRGKRVVSRRGEGRLSRWDGSSDCSFLAETVSRLLGRQGGNSRPER